MFGLSIPRHLWSVLVCISLAGHTLGPHLYARQYPLHERGPLEVKNFSSREHGGESQTFSMVPGVDGILYFANGTGILEYDGSKWRIIKTPNSSACLSLKKIDSIVYAGAQNEIGRLTTNAAGYTSFESFCKLIPKEDRNFREVWNIIPYQGKVIFQAVNTILVYDGRSVVVHKASSAFTREFFHKGDTLMLQLQTGELYTLTDSGLARYMQLPQLEQYRITYFSEERSDGSFLVGTYQHGLFVLHNDGHISAIQSPLSIYLKTHFLNRWCRLTDGQIALSTFKKGVIIVDDSLRITEKIDKTAGLSNESVWNVGLDEMNNLWAITDNGISRVSLNSGFRRFGEKEGLSGTVQDITRYKGDLYATTNIGVFRLKKGNASQVGENLHPRWETISGNNFKSWFFAIHQNTLLFSSESGVAKYDGRSSSYIASNPARALIVSTRHPRYLYVGFTDGIGVFALDKNYTFLGRVPGIEVEIRSMQEDKEGNLWLGTFVDGVIKLIPDNQNPLSPTVIRFGTAEGLSHLNDNEVFKYNDDIVFATPGGLKAPDANSGKIVDYAGFGEDYTGDKRWVYRMTQASDSQVWLSAYNLTELTLATAVSPTVDYSRKPFRELNEFPVYAIYPEQDVVWLGGPEGIISYDKNMLLPKGPKVLLRKISINEDSVAFAGNGEFHKLGLDDQFNNIRIEVSSSYLQHEEENRYQFYLEGFDKEWSAWTKENFRVYTTLPAGTYTFNFRTQNLYGDISDIQSFAVYMPPPWYLQPLFLIPVSILLIYLLVIVIRYLSTRKLIRRVEELEMQQKVQKERERISSDLHDHVGAQLTSIIAGLQITEQIEDFQRNKQVREIIDSLKEDASQTMTSLRDSIWSLHQKEVTVGEFVEHTENYVRARLRYYPHISFNSCIEGEKRLILAPTLALHLLRAVQESFQNILKHALATGVMLSIKVDESQLVLKISDNGVGFALSPSMEGHYGLENMKKRMEQLDGTFIIDTQPGMGTTVTFEVPLDSSVEWRKHPGGK